VKIRDAVKNFKPYEPGNFEAEIRMDKNESPFSLPTELKREILSELEKLTINRYPHPGGDSLREKLAQFHNLNRDNIVVGSGSDQLISYSTNLFAGEYSVITPPTFSMYRFYSELNGLEVRSVPLDEKFELQLDKLKSEASGAAVVFLCSPNNPTGNKFDRGDIVEVLETGVPVILDEAYGEFAEESNMDLIQSYDNLLVLRTFSKAFGLAGARVGYVVGSTSIINYLIRVKPPYNLNSFSLRIAELLLDNSDLIGDRISFLAGEREKLYRKFHRYTYPSQANFLLIDLDAADFLLERGISVRRFTGRLSDKIRVTMGTEKENDLFSRALEEYISTEL